jgi:hypothetical protein
MRTVLMTMLAAALLTPLAACKTTDTGVTDVVCGPWRAITWSAKDTPETIDEVKGNNARRKAWCPK